MGFIERSTLFKKGLVNQDWPLTFSFDLWHWILQPKLPTWTSLRDQHSLNKGKVYQENMKQESVIWNTMKLRYYKGPKLPKAEYQFHHRGCIIGLNRTDALIFYTNEDNHGCIYKRTYSFESFHWSHSECIGKLDVPDNFYLFEASYNITYFGTYHYRCLPYFGKSGMWVNKISVQIEIILYVRFQINFFHVYNISR